MRKGWDGGEPGDGLEQDWGTHSPSARFRLQFQIRARSSVGCGFFLQSSLLISFEVHVDTGATKGEMKASPALYNKTIFSPPSLR